MLKKNKINMFRKLRNRFLMLNMSIIFMVMITAFISVYFMVYHMIQKENKNRLTSMISMSKRRDMNTTFESEFNTKNNKICKGIIPADFYPSFNIVVDNYGEIIKINSYIDMLEEDYFRATEIALNNKKNNIISLNNKKWMYNIISLKDIFSNGEKGKKYTKDNYQIMFLDVTDNMRTLKKLFYIFFIVGIFMIFVIFLISLYFANKAIKPIIEAWNREKQFIADASHELKTPLAIINANIDAIFTEEEKIIKSQKKWLGYIRIEIDRMNKLLQNLIYLAKSEDINLKLKCETFNFSDLVNDIILSMEAIIYEEGITLSHIIQDELLLKGDLEKIKQVVLILMDNAIKYTDKLGSINITLQKDKNNIIFCIQNSGKGIPKNDLPKLFNRFYRVDSSRIHKSGGYGLGLSIAKSIIDKLGGEIYVTSVENKSTTFTFIIKE